MQSSDPRLFGRAAAAFQNGSYDDAERDFKKVLRGEPRHFGALNFYAILLMQRGRLEDAVPLLRRAVSVNPGSDATHYNLGLALKGLKKPLEALEAFSKSLDIKPSAETWNNRGTIFNDLGRYDEAVRDFDQAIALAPDFLGAFHNRGNSLVLAGRIDEAESAYDLALKINPDFSEGLIGRANVHMIKGQFADALRLFLQATKINSHLPEAWVGQARALAALDRYDEALNAYQAALKLKPDLVDAWVGAGDACNQLQRYSDAFGAFQKALEIKSDSAEAWLGLANTNSLSTYRDAALEAYTKAIAIKPDLAEAWNGRGFILNEMKRRDEGLASFDRALEINPKFAAASFGRGFLLSELGRYSEAAVSFRAALDANPKFKHVKGALIYAKEHCCDWDNLTTEWSGCLADIEAGIASTWPFPALTMGASPAQQFECARLYCRNHFSNAQKPLWQGDRYAHERIRIGYLSGDFHAHAVSFLAAGMFEHHDRHAFETIAISVGPDDNSATRTRLVAAFERFVDAQSMPDKQIAELIRSLEIDILVDLTGHTTGSRLGVLAWRPAPLQATYLGYPGTTGADFIDYIIADPTVIPPEHRRYYTEQVAYLPDSYLPNDISRPIGTPPSRSSAHLPEDGFVFCSFNNAYKITPHAFDIWMRLLNRVEGSVLWLPKFNNTASENLRKEAENRGVSPDRIVFADRTATQEDHLARLKLADLFLDTEYYNAHSTACDALWAGVPLVTCIGSAFAGRVGASVLKAVGLPELVTTSPEDYEALALKLATDPALLASIKAKLATQRLTAPLFDTERFTRNIEAIYLKMWQRAQAGEAPGPLSL